MTSPSAGLMYNITPTRVSVVKRPANKRKFLVTKNEGSMETILEIIKSAEAPNDEALIDSLKGRGVAQDGIDAAVAVNRVLNAFADTLTEEDLRGIAKSVDFNIGEAEVTEEGSVETTTTEESEVTKHDNSEMVKLREEVAQLKADRRLGELREMAKEVKIGDQEEILDTLKGIDAVGGDVTKALSVLKKASAAVEAAVGVEIGSSASGEEEEGYSALKAEAQRIAEEKGVSVQKAQQILSDTRPDFVAKHLGTDRK